MIPSDELALIVDGEIARARLEDLVLTLSPAEAIVGLKALEAALGRAQAPTVSRVVRPAVSPLRASASR